MNTLMNTLKSGDIALYNQGKNSVCVLIIKEIQKAWGAKRFQVTFLDKKIYVWDKHLKRIEEEIDGKS